MKLFFALLLFFFLSVEANLHILAASTFNKTFTKDTRIYFMSNGSKDALKQVTITAANSQINTNVYAYSVPQTDGTVRPLIITAESDDLLVTKPDGVTVQVSLYYNKDVPNLNVFPVFESSSIQFKSGVNAFFAIDKPSEKILQVRNLRIGGNTNVVGHAGVPGVVTPYVFFDASIYRGNNYYRLLNVPRVNFYFEQIDSGVTYEVGFGVPDSSLQDAGVIMTAGFPTDVFATDTLHNVKSNGGDVILNLKPFFWSEFGYNTEITVYFEKGAAQGNSFPSVGDGKLQSQGKITHVEVESSGPYAIQYFVNQSATSPLQTTPSSSFETTTRSSQFTSFVLSILSVSVTMFIQ